VLVLALDVLAAVDNANGKLVEDAVDNTEPPAKPPDAPTKKVVPNGSVEEEAALLPNDVVLVLALDVLAAVDNANGKLVEDAVYALLPPNEPPELNKDTEEAELICDATEGGGEGKGRGVKQEKRETGEINLAVAGGLECSSVDAMQSVGDFTSELDCLGDITAPPSDIRLLHSPKEELCC
jgi:hypothetical protein